MKRFKTVDEYIDTNEFWQASLVRIRQYLLTTELQETVKWGMPVYTIDNKNVVGLCGFKNHFGLWFYQGVFLSDPHKLLVNAQEGKTKGMRHLKYRDHSEVDMDVIKSYVTEAIANQKTGKMIAADRSPRRYFSPYLDEYLRSDGEMNESFESLSNFKQQEYHEYMMTAKQEKTKERRLEKIKPLITVGQGLNDKYRK